MREVCESFARRLYNRGATITDERTLAKGERRKTHLKMQDSRLICLWQLFLLRASAEFEQAQLRIRLGVSSKLGFDLIKPHYLRPPYGRVLLFSVEQILINLQNQQPPCEPAHLFNLPYGRVLLFSVLRIFFCLQNY